MWKNYFNDQFYTDSANLDSVCECQSDQGKFLSTTCGMWMMSIYTLSP